MIALQISPKIVQSLNSPFFPPHIGAEPGRAKRESRITCMRMLRTPPFFPPKSREKPYLEVLSRFGLWRDFLNDREFSMTFTADGKRQILPALIIYSLLVILK